MIRPAPMQHVGHGGHERAILRRGPLYDGIGADIVISFRELLAFGLLNPEPRTERKTERRGLDLKQQLLAFLRGEGEAVFAARLFNAARHGRWQFYTSWFACGIARRLLGQFRTVTDRNRKRVFKIR